jgi:Ca-activated chloride channel family protein
VTLAWPNALWGLLLVPAMVIAFALDGQKRRRELERIGHLPQIRKMTASVSVGRRRLKALLLVAGVAAVVLSLARPQLMGAAHILPRRGLDLVVALDFSRSMLATDVYPSRLERAKLELNKLIDGLQGDRVGLVAFSGVTLSYPLTSDYAAAKLFWRDLAPSDIPVGGTNLGGAIRDALELLDHGRSAKPGGDARKPAQVILLLTDGADTEGSPERGPLEAAREAAKRGVKIYAVGIGSREGDFVMTKEPGAATTEYIKGDDGQPVRMALDEETLKQAASTTGGEYFQVDPERLGVERVQRAIATLERTEEETRVVREPDEAFAWFLVPGFLLLLGEALVSERRKGPRIVKPVESRPSQPKTIERGGRAARRLGSTTTATLAVLAALLPALGGWSWFERPSPDVQESNKKLVAGKAEEALGGYDHAVEAKPDDLAAHYDRGAALYALGRFPEAQREFARATDSPDPALKADSYYNMGNALFKQEQLKEAAEAYKRSLRLRPDDRRTKWNLELALRKLDEEQQKKQRQQKQGDQKDDQEQQAREDQQPKKKDEQQEQKDPQKKKDQQQDAASQQKKPDEKKNDSQQDAASQQQQQAPAKPEQPNKPAAAGAEPRAPRDIEKQDAEAVLDAFERVEPTVQKDLARRRAGNRRPRKDW